MSGELMAAWRDRFEGLSSEGKRQKQGAGQLHFLGAIS